MTTAPDGDREAGSLTRQVTIQNRMATKSLDTAWDYKAGGRPGSRKLDTASYGTTPDGVQTPGRV